LIEAIQIITSTKRQMKNAIIGIFIVIAVAGGLAYVKYGQINTLIVAGKNMVMPPEAIAAGQVKEEKWPDSLPTVGTVAAVQGVTIAPEIAGKVVEIAFESGATVQAGDLLVRLDTTTEEAQLRAAEAQADLARLNAERNRKLREGNTVSQSELDTTEATLKQALANADNIRTVIAKKNIRAPFAGRLGIRAINLGEQLTAGQTIVSLQALSPVYVDSSLSQQELSRLHTGLKVQVTLDTYPGKIFTGELTALNPDLDTVTRNIRVRAQLDNQEGLLRPGMFVSENIVFPDEKPVLVVPATAVVSSPYGDSVFVVTPSPEKGATNLVVEQKFVRTGRTRGDYVSVETGLKAGERVATSGVFKLRNHMSVVEKNDAAPQPSQTPTPPNA
jgi:membrane fusion protein, multidrug efflux system